MKYQNPIISNMKYQNPIIRGFHPDPSICRAGEDYYLVTSSMEYFPGLPLFHSRDLVNWEQIGNCIDRPEQLDMKNACDSGGIWAPTIRYDRGVFYVTATLDAYGNFIISTEDPYKEWSDPVWVNMGGIDPSLYFEDGKAYYCTNQSLHPGMEEITLAEIDIISGERRSPVRTIWCGTGGGHLEGPHIYLVNGWYYLLAAEGGTNFNHMATIARSRSIWGPYESCPRNPILTNRHDTVKQVQCSGHGDLFEDHRGNWWMVHLAIRTARRTMTQLGRETFLTPVVWENGWPGIGTNKMAALEQEGPLWEEQQETIGWSADFSSKEWEPQWIFVREKKPGLFQRGEGKLRLYPSVRNSAFELGQTFAAARPLDFACEMETIFRFWPDKTGDEAGIAVYLQSDFHYRFGRKKTEQGEFLVLEKIAEDFHQTACRIPVKPGRTHLKIVCSKEKYDFYYAMENEQMRLACSASTRFLSCEVAGRCFTGTVMGLYASAEVKTDAYADFENFKMRR
ncbi:MAG: glycoside hydrolase family 43 protein [Eubacteriales bacterium]|nr:glycoside hydrolase family 43 protein [Eubacteriales bacterium]